MKVAIVGGTGAFGQALALRLREAGDEVTIGSRDAERAREAATELRVRGERNDEAVRDVDLVVLAVKADTALAVAKELAGAVGETPLLCVASELRPGADGMQPGAEGRSLAERVAEVVDAPVAAGLHSLASRSLGGKTPPDEDALVCGDDERAKQSALELAGRVVAGRAIDAGPLACARALEGMTAVIVNVNRRYRAHAGLRLTGLP